MNRMLQACFLAAFAAVSMVPAAVAQTPDTPDAIPTELALALLSSYGGPDGEFPEILVGAAPAGSGLPMPTHARILGSLARGNLVTVVARTAPPASDAREAFLSGLRAEGWAEPDRARPARGGFVSTAEWRTDVLCRGGSESVRVRAADRDGAGYLWVIHDDRADRPSACDPPERRRMWRTDAPIPTLEPPRGARARSFGGMSGGDEFSTRATITTPLLAPALADHFAVQLREQGWRAVAAPAPHQQVAVQLWEKETSDGELWRGTLLVHTLGESDRRYAIFQATGPGRDRVF